MLTSIAMKIQLMIMTPRMKYSNGADWIIRRQTLQKKLLRLKTKHELGWSTGGANLWGFVASSSKARRRFKLDLLIPPGIPSERRLLSSYSSTSKLSKDRLM